METKVNLLVDFGNSGTRVQFLHDNKRYKFNLSNRFGKVVEGTRLNKRYQNELTTVLRVDGAIYCNGRIVEQEFNSTAIRPDSLASKVEQDVTYISLRLAIAKVYMILSKVTGCPIKDLKVTFDVNVLLPPIHVDTQAKDFKDRIKQIKHVEILSPVFETPYFTIDKAEVYSEGVAAFTGVFYKEINQQYLDNSNADTLGYEVYDNSPSIEVVEVEENQPFADGYTIVFDIGAGTTDVCIFRNFELIERSKETFNIGGNLVNSELDRIFRETPYNFRAEDDNILNAILTGVLKEGVKEHFVEKEVLRAKEAYSNVIVPDVRRYLERIGIDVKSISGMLVCGGGSVATVRDGVEVAPAMSEVLLNYIKKLAPNIGLLKTEGNLRELNINGLYILSKYE